MTKNKKIIVSEKKLESDFKKETEKRNGHFVKLNSVTHSGLPDRLLLFPMGIVVFIEFKTTGETLDPLQEWWRDKMGALYMNHFIVDSEVSFAHALRQIDLLLDTNSKYVSNLFKK